MTFPRKLNLGSGKDFRIDYLNVDINDHWSPDIIADISVPFPASGSRCFPSRRFGEIELVEHTFDEIIANDVLEHVSDLVSTMTNCLYLLRIGGRFNINVPYDLSYGAWQDPTHVRAFNERSWTYFSDWFWYLGWKTHRFLLRSLEFQVSTVGKELLDQGLKQDVLLRTPRAIDSMKVSLEKVPLSEADHHAYQAMVRTGKNLAEGTVSPQT